MGCLSTSRRRGDGRARCAERGDEVEGEQEEQRRGEQVKVFGDGMGSGVQQESERSRQGLDPWFVLSGPGHTLG